MKRRLKKKYKVFFKKLILFLLITLFLIIFILSKVKNNDEEEINSINKIILTIDESYKLEVDSGVNIKLNTDIISITDNTITGKKLGSAIIELEKGKNKKTIDVIVTDLYTLPHIDNDKKALGCKIYTEDEAKTLDEALLFKINNAGYKTRAGVVAAARFLTLEFKYKISYFYENGRLNNYAEKEYVDGEGRYYHKGLYLSENKFENIKASLYGPSIWGCPLYSKLFKRDEINGLDCSGYISWAFLNGGFDIGDSGAGIDFERNDDLDDFGTKMKISESEFDKTKVKVGDLISRYGHIGIIIGIENNNYYVAEALDYDLHVKTFTEEELIKSDWLYIQLMDEYYKKDGNLTTMW